MNHNWLKIFNKYRERKYKRDLDKLENDMASRGMASSGIRNREELWLKEDYDDEVAMKSEEVSVLETEREEERSERKWSKIANGVLASVAVLGFFATLGISLFTIQSSKEANQINKQAAELEYSNRQPFLAIAGGNADGTDVIIKNAGGGPAKDIFFLKHYRLAGTENDVYVLTRDLNVGLALGAGDQGHVNLNEKFMDHLNNKDEVLSKVTCVIDDILSKNGNWEVAFYRNLQGEQFISMFNGSGSKYAEGVDYKKLSCGENKLVAPTTR